MGLINIVHPGTVISPQKVHTMLNPKDDKIKTATKKLLDFVNIDIALKSNAITEIRVGYNPAPHDLEKKTLQEQEYWKKRKTEENDLLKKGLIGGHDNFTKDGERCYKHTIAYLITKDCRFADKCIEILMSWCTTCTKFGIINENGPLEAGWGLSGMVMAAELLKYNYPKWNDVTEKQFISFVDKVLYPQLSFFIDTNTRLLKGFVCYGNWGTTITQARLQYAIFKNDNKEIDACVQSTKMLFDNLLISNTGQEVETLRDIVHNQFGLAGLTGISEILWHQGIDTYSLKNSLLCKAYEYVASILLGEIPEDIKGKELHWVGWIPTNWEMVYNHFVNRKNMSMPKTNIVLNKNRPEDFSFHWGLGTVTHYMSF